MQSIKYIRQRVSVTPGDKRLTNAECFKERLKPALWMVAMFTIMGFIAAPITIYGVAYLAGVPAIAWQAIPIMGFMMMILGALASLGMFVDPIPPTEKEVDDHNRFVYEELKKIYG